MIDVLRIMTAQFSLTMYKGQDTITDGTHFHTKMSIYVFVYVYER